MLDAIHLVVEGDRVAVYGEAATHRIYGDIMPVPRERIVETDHQSTLKLNGRELVFFDTPGHARHHVCVLDPQSGHLFAGDIELNAQGLGVWRDAERLPVMRF